MRIYIPTHGRGPERQTTYRELGELADQYEATLVAAPSDVTAFKRAGFRVVSCPVQGDIGKVRQWILKQADEELIMMMDDDLSSWCARRHDTVGGKVRYTVATLPERREHFKRFERLMKDYAHGAFGHRLFANDREVVEVNTRLLRALAYRVDVLQDEKIKFRMSLMEDLDVQLSLMKRGYTCVQYNGITHEQPGSNTSGGCSMYRNAERQKQAAEQLAAFHPECVKVVEKKLKVGWGGEIGDTRTDVRVSWRSAVAIGDAHAQKRGKYHASYR